MAERQTVFTQMKLHFSLSRLFAEDICDEFYRRLITFANSMDPDQVGQNNAGSDLNPNRLIL